MVACLGELCSEGLHRKKHGKRPKREKERKKKKRTIDALMHRFFFLLRSQPAPAPSLSLSLSLSLPLPLTNELINKKTVLSDAVPLVASRALVSDAPEALSSGFAADPRKRAEALSNALELLHPRAISFEASGAPARLRRALAAAHEACEEWGAAARALAGIDVESVGATASEAAAAAGTSNGEVAKEGEAAAAKPLSLAPATAEKLRHCVRVAMLYLEDEDAGSAEVYVKKGAPFAAALASAAAAEARNSSSSAKFDDDGAAATADLGLELQYRSCAARVLDARRDFTRAAAAYATLSRARDGALGGGVRAPPVGFEFDSFFPSFFRGGRGLTTKPSKKK